MCRTAHAAVAREGGLNVAPESFVDGSKEEVVSDAQPSALRGGDADEVVAVLGTVAHGLLDEDIDAGFEHRAGSFKVTVGRQQHVDCIERLRCKHGIQRAVDFRDAEFACEGLGLAEESIAHCDEFDAGHSAKTLSVPVRDVSRAEERNPAAGLRSASFGILSAFRSRTGRLVIRRLDHDRAELLLYSMMVMPRPRHLRR